MICIYCMIIIILMMMSNDDNKDDIADVSDDGNKVLVLKINVLIKI